MGESKTPIKKAEPHLHPKHSSGTAPGKDYHPTSSPTLTIHHWLFCISLMTRGILYKHVESWDLCNYNAVFIGTERLPAL
jgi:hypothetical protein